MKVRAKVFIVSAKNRTGATVVQAESNDAVPLKLNLVIRVTGFFCVRDRLAFLLVFGAPSAISPSTIRRRRESAARFHARQETAA